MTTENPNPAQDANSGAGLFGCGSIPRDQHLTHLLPYPGPDCVLEAYIAHPPLRQQPLPCVMLGHDGGSDAAGIRAVAHKIASLGAVAFVLDTHGIRAGVGMQEDRSHLMAPLLEDRARLRERLLAGYHAARSLTSVDPGKLAVIGFQFGGLCALELARADPDGLLATISVNAIHASPRDLCAHSIRSRVLLLHEWSYAHAANIALPSLADEMTRAGADWQMLAYSSARQAAADDKPDAAQRDLTSGLMFSRRIWPSIVHHLAEILQC